MEEIGDITVPVDFKNTLTAKIDLTNQRMNVAMAPRGLVQAVLREALVVEFPSGAGAVKVFMERSQSSLRDEGIPELIKKLDEDLGGAAERLVEDMNNLIDERFEVEKQCLKRLKRFSELDPVHAKCSWCQDKRAVTRSEFVVCFCNPKQPYVCQDCVRYVNHWG